MKHLTSLPISVNISDQQQEDDGWRYVAIGE